jgi:protein-S-isoprenylcysteine O-methyltransferase Ste14
MCAAGAGASRREASMTRMHASIGTALFLVLVPGIIAGAIPWWVSHWQIKPGVLDIGALKIIGGILIFFGLLVLLDSFARFALQGIGTPAPIAPTRHLVVTGVYRHVRNPMYVAVTALVLGQALLFAREGLLVYGAALWLAFHLFILFYEEPTLRKGFGNEYERYIAHVPRWLPRLRPWSPGD